MIMWCIRKHYMLMDAAWKRSGCSLIGCECLWCYQNVCGFGRGRRDALSLGFVLCQRVCQFASLYLLTEPRGWNSFWLKRAEQMGVDGKIKNRNEKGKIERGVSGEMEWYVARPGLIRQRWERKATDKRPTTGRQRSRNHNDLPGDFRTDNVVLSLNGGCMLQDVCSHISVFKKCKCACWCVFFCAVEVDTLVNSGSSSKEWKTGCVY